MHARSIRSVVLGLVLASPVAFGAPASSANTAAPATPPTLMWTEETQGWTGGDWNGGAAAAANHVEGGYADWRLPTIQELQGALQVPDGQPGSWGTSVLHPDGNGRGWTSNTQGKWAFAVTIATQGGDVVPGSSGQATRYLKASNFARTKFVRP